RARPAARPGPVPGGRRPPGGQHRRPRLRAPPRRRRGPAGPPRPPAHPTGATWEDTQLVVVAGGAGFLGASLVDRLPAEGDEVVVVDDLSHGHLANLAEARRRGGVRFHRTEPAPRGL